MADDIGSVPTASYELLDFASAADHGIIFKEVKNRGNRQSKHKWEAQIPLGAVDSYVANEEKRTTCNYVLAPVRSCMHFLLILFYFVNNWMLIAGLARGQAARGTTIPSPRKIVPHGACTVMAISAACRISEGPCRVTPESKNPRAA